MSVDKFAANQSITINSRCQSTNHCLHGNECGGWHSLRNPAARSFVFKSLLWQHYFPTSWEIERWWEESLHFAHSLRKRYLFFNIWSWCALNFSVRSFASRYNILIMIFTTFSKEFWGKNLLRQRLIFFNYFSSTGWFFTNHMAGITGIRTTSRGIVVGETHTAIGNE